MPSVILLFVVMVPEQWMALTRMARMSLCMSTFIRMLHVYCIVQLFNFQCSSQWNQRVSPSQSVFDLETSQSTNITQWLAKNHCLSHRRCYHVEGRLGFKRLGAIIFNDQSPNLSAIKMPFSVCPILGHLTPGILGWIILILNYFRKENISSTEHFQHSSISKEASQLMNCWNWSNVHI